MTRQYSAVGVERHQVKALSLFGDVHPYCDHYGDGTSPNNLKTTVGPLVASNHGSDTP